MGPLAAVALRWLVAGVAMSLGIELGKTIINKANEGEWLTKGMEDTMKDIKHTWMGHAPEKPEADETKNS
jgi:hypothetical protein